jgi:hypothetical protein
MYGNSIIQELGEIKTYADIAGCFGFGANAMAFHISKVQGYYPDTKVFEISQDFITKGKLLFPYIDFIQDEFDKWTGTPPVFDLVTLFDTLEHIPEPQAFLSTLSLHTKFALLKTPMETTGEWRGSHPPAKQGGDHSDGHVNFFTPKSYVAMLKESNFKIVKERLVRSIIPPGSMSILAPEVASPKSKLKRIAIQLARRILSHSLLPYALPRKILGDGDHLCLIKSNSK